MAEGGARPPASYEAVGCRQRFTVELRPGETTIVSWKKLLKDTSNNNASTSKPNNGPGPVQPGPPSDQLLPPPLPPAQLPPGQVLEKEAGEGPPTSRLGTVIEKIERLYVGKASSDEEDHINDVVPDDDEYDTEDSFIDDAELDEYFQVDNSAIKHDGFFVNRGKLERIEPTALPNEQPKKRRRKDLAKDQSDDVRLNPNKHLKVRKKAGKSLNGKNSPSMHPEEANFQNHSKNHVSKLNEGSELANSSNERLNDKESFAQGKLSSGRSINNGELNASIQQRENGDFHKRHEISVTEGNNAQQIEKIPLIQKKEGSSGRPKSTVLEKAIRDLEKLVSESRPPAVEVHDADNNTSQAVKRRLAPEVKQKLAKVARLAQASHGKITKELLDRLMAIVGHMIQLRSLKRNLEIMVNVGLSAKQEKDNRVHQIKKEVAEMVSMRIPALEQQAGTSEDFQEKNTDEKETFKRNYSMDDALEDIICDLYDLYVEGLDEDAGPQVRKLYSEVAAFWPRGFMNNHGVKRAICRAKDRRRALQSRHKDQQKKIKKKQLLVPKTEETVQVGANSVAQPLYARDDLVPVARDHGSSENNSISSNAAVQTSFPYMNGSNTNRLKQEKVNHSLCNSGDTKAADVMPRKKGKRKPDVESCDAHVHSDLNSMQAEERQKSQKQVVVPLPQPNTQPAVPDFKPSS